jgi:hypothetical protein
MLYSLFKVRIAFRLFIELLRKQRIEVENKFKYNRSQFIQDIIILDFMLPLINNFL